MRENPDPSKNPKFVRQERPPVEISRREFLGYTAASAASGLMANTKPAIAPEQEQVVFPPDGTRWSRLPASTNIEDRRKTAFAALDDRKSQDRVSANAEFPKRAPTKNDEPLSTLGSRLKEFFGLGN